MVQGAISCPTNTGVAVVTGGNKGIGLEVCRQLAGNSGITVILTARDEARGAAAVEKLREQGLSNVVFHQLDIGDARSIARLAEFLKTQFEKLDILVNNAAFGGVEYIHGPEQRSQTSEEEFTGMDMDQRFGWLWHNCRETYETAKEGLRINYYGTKNVTEALLPLLQASADGRIVNVSSHFGQLRLFRNEELKQELNDIDNLTSERLDDLLNMFLKDFEDNVVEARGWPMAFSAYKTDLTINSGLLTPEEGGSRVVAVALLPAGSTTGAFFEDFKESSFI
ncbi:hypothetical protein QOZ80_4AG0309410 [Eleusine coracana subsp. coracana]|nr:hypothetical protein QOZ80_4AG0309410 [Eleusine coracana subsp. coracana]